MSAELKNLRRERGSLKSQLTLFEKFLNTNNVEEVDKKIFHSNLALRLEKIETIFDSFNKIQSQIESIEEAQGKHTEVDNRETFQNDYFKLVGQAKIILTNEIAAQPVSHNPRSVIKLPTISLDKFDGCFTKWRGFNDAFKSMVDQNINLSNVQKLSYLKASLSGEPKALIDPLETINENYTIAWELLTKRYENKRRIVNNHVQNILNIPNITRESHNALRDLINVASNNIQCLKALGQPTHDWDALVVPIILTKLDNLTAKDWETKLANSNDNQSIPTLVDFLEFLNNKQTMLENISNRKINDLNLNKPSYGNKLVKSFAITNISTSCLNCNGDHSIQNCESFLKLDALERSNKIKEFKICLNCLRKGHFVPQCKSPSVCKVCRRKHHTLIHLDFKQSVQSMPVTITTPADEISNSSSREESIVMSCMSNSQVLLSTALIKVYDADGHEHFARALLDSASHSNFITDRLCNLLKLTREPTNIDVVGINQAVTTLNHKVTVTLKSNICNYTNSLSCLVLPIISNSLPGRAVDLSLLKIPPNLKLADPTFYKPNSIDLLLGAGIFWELLSIGQIQESGKPTLQKTKLGWIVSGELIQEKRIASLTSTYLSLNTINKNIENFWKIDEFISNTEVLTNDEQYCEDLFNKTTKRASDGKFIVRIPFKSNLKHLGNSYETAEARLGLLEKRLRKDQELKHSYNKFIHEYRDLDHMSKINVNKKETAFYMPHHPVIKESSSTTKLRIVFDGSCKIDSGLSINQTQHIGPTLQNELFLILINFRCYKWVIVADIAKMYRQIWVHPEDRKYQRILWRDDPQQEIEVYELKTVTYGMTSAPYLAIRCLNQLAKENINEYPMESKIIEDNFYVDDILTGSNSLLELSIIRNNLIKILKSAGFELRKWMSNSLQLLKDPTEIINEIPLAESYQKTLGICWNPSEDNFLYSTTNLRSSNRVTKRTILSITAQMFDPLGLLAPIIILAKFIIQKLWTLKLGWDESIPSNLHTEWLSFKDSLKFVDSIRIPRHVILTDAIKVELHAFSDASEQGYGTCIYLRSIDKNSKILVSLIAAKSRVAPLKNTTIPRLELCAAVLSAQLVSKIKPNLKLKITTEYYWSDSQIVLCWLKSDKKLKTYVANRVSEIKTFTNSSNWHYVKSADNAADLISRGVSPIHLADSNIWWHGPEWLSNLTDYWPEESIKLETISVPEVHEPQITFVSQGKESFDLITRFSSLSKLKRITALCLRFIHNCRVPKSEKLKNNLSQCELENAFLKLLKFSQSESFHSELNQFSQTKSLSSNKNKLSSLNPFLDEFGIIRVGGRLKYSDYDFNKKHPILLSSKHYLTKLIFSHEHKLLLHAPAGLLLNSIRERFWPVHGRNLARQIVKQCVTCFRFTAKPVNPIMGQLPKERVTIMPPFFHTGIDYAGPFSVKDRKSRGCKITKCYISLFICFSTKAIHLELVSDLTTNSFLTALRRFIARRGKPQVIYSDNGTNFVGATNELKQLGEFLLCNQDLISREASNHCLSWQFIPPHSPHFGGLWEAGVKTVKYHFKRIFRNTLLTFEEFSTVLTQIESIINSRPLTPLSSDPNDMSPLTPAHFLIGRPFTTIADPNLLDVPLNRLNRFQYLQQLNQHFWTRWSKEYVSEIQQLTKWRQVQPELQNETLVLIKEDNQPPANWLLGRIVQRHPGTDNVTRVVSIRLPNGSTIKRPVHKICALPLDNKSN